MFETITHPWREPVDYFKLAFWTIIFLIVVSIVWDGLRLIATFAANAASEVVS